MHEANVMVCLCHAFCIPPQLIRVCDALPTTILLGDGDGKDWRGDTFVNPQLFFYNSHTELTALTERRSTHTV